MQTLLFSGLIGELIGGLDCGVAGGRQLKNCARKQALKD